jgi:hypothetical protein
MACVRAAVFAIGDVRAGSIKRVAAAMGEGAQVVAFLVRPHSAEGTKARDFRRIEDREHLIRAFARRSDGRGLS